MTANTIGVGIIGASPDRGWAMDAHIPALKALPQYKFVAASTSRKASADAAAKMFGVPAFDNHQALLARPDVDLAVIAVKVPYHLELTTAALKARKAVYCEWPLGNGLAEAEQLAKLAREMGVVARVGLQARSAPVVNHVRQLLKDGYVGTVLSSSIVASGLNWGADILETYRYLLDRKSGGSMLTIPFGHAVDAFCWCLGEFEELNATFATRRPQVKLLDGKDGMVASDIADQVSVTGTLKGGAVASIHFRGGLSRGTNFLWEINGTEGDLTIEGINGHLQMMPVTLKGGRGAAKSVADLPLPADCRWAPANAPQGIPYNLTQAYVRMEQDLRTGSETVPTFDDAVVRHRMIEAISEAARTGKRQSYDTIKPR